MKSMIMYAGILLASFTTAGSNCPAKISDQQSSTCELFNSKPDTARLIFAIGFTRPHFSEENTPENRAKLRKWTDSLFQTYELRLVASPGVRAEPPSDSQLDWVTDDYYIIKSTALSISELEFIKFLSYRDKPTQTVVVKKRNSRAFSGPGRSPSFDANGRRAKLEKEWSARENSQRTVIYEVVR